MTRVVLVETLGRVIPGFAAHWARGDSLFVDTNGEFTSHGVFAECSGYVRENYHALSDDSLKELAAFISSCLERVYGEDIENAAATCFLENLAGKPFHEEFSAYLRPAARSSYNRVVKG